MHDQSPVDLLVRQLSAIDAWNRGRREREKVAEAPAAVVRSREERMDRDRSVAMLACTHEAVVAWTSRLLARDPGPLRSSLPPRAVLVHRNAWFAGRLAALLAERGVLVVATLDNGADALGTVIAEQPDLLLAEDALPLLGGAELAAQTAVFAPQTLSVVQVSGSGRADAVLRAGAASVVVRSTPPAQVAEQLVRALAQRDRPGRRDLS